MRNRSKNLHSRGKTGTQWDTVSRPHSTLLDYNEIIDEENGDIIKIIDPRTRRVGGYKFRESQVKLYIMNNIFEVYISEEFVRYDLGLKSIKKKVANKRIQDIENLFNGYLIDVPKEKKTQRKKSKRKKKRTEEYRQQRTRMAKTNIRRCITKNFTNRSKFITLTFRDTDNIDITNINDAYFEFKKFIQRLRFQYGDFKYLQVIEFQKRGAIHFHMITDLSYIPNQELALVWGNGFTKINDISKVTNIGAYMVKYMTKNMSDERLQGRRCYTKSRNVKPPIPIRNIYAYAILNQIKGYKATYQNSYQSKYHRKIIYKQYTLQEKVIRRLSANNPQVLPYLT